MHLHADGFFVSYRFALSPFISFLLGSDLILLSFRVISVFFLALQIFRHNHERENGRTSCASQHIMGFDSELQPVHQPVSGNASAKQTTRAWQAVVKQSDSIITFIDLAGHEKYLKTTIGGLTGCFPDFAMIICGANMGEPFCC